MIKISLNKIAKITSGKIINNIYTEIDNIIINSKKITLGSLFIALVGNNFNAHHFINEAIIKGAQGLLIEKEVQYNIPQILVTNTSKALEEIASWLRKTTNVTLIALTGSSGKTSVKEITAKILKKKGKTIFTPKNLNNKIGVSITLLKLKEHHKYAVIEVGANNPGEIKYINKIIKPNIVLINNIHYAHLKGFKSINGVAKAKQEIFSNLDEKGIIIINSDSNKWKIWNKSIKDKKVLCFSIKRKADFFADNIYISTKGLKFNLNTRKNKIPIKVPLLGTHNISNILAATAIVSCMNLPLKKIKNTITKLKQITGRLKIIKLSKKKYLIDDTYNANIGSMNAAINFLNSINGYKIIITGDMHELGDKSTYYHKFIGNKIKNSKINRIFSIGKLSQHISKQNKQGQHFYTHEELVNKVKKLIMHKKNIIVLIKGSRNSKMEKILGKIQEKITC
ncbi:UDP-N-acetylmuramoyl-tripeptide--D-alanyl-D-alanine ligase [Buchnera aphidicola (Neophyllaphis podocarpi)]|uniref:UDP-N-acetylmuramoyl-tripeptide--D-alanyl-D- alanine ligase n=1 Tax=Buchnera aphidicola TaxID=9 RepID=UPI003463D920